MLPGITPMNIKGSPIIPFSLSYLGQQAFAGSAAAYSFVFNVPASTVNQILIVRFSFISAGAAQPVGSSDISSVVWNGITGTQIDWEFAGNTTTGWAYQAVYRLLVPPASSGVSSAVTATLSAVRLGGSTTCYLITAPKKLTPDDHDTASPNSNIDTLSLTETAGGIALIFHTSRSNAVPTYTGATKNLDAALTATWRVSSGAAAVATTGTGTYTVTAATGNLNCIIGATFH